RARGPVQILTRQPTQGRSRAGGLRWGEMEVDCLVGHGASILLRETIRERSDLTRVYICEECGALAVQAQNRKLYCPICGEKARISKTVVSYAFKLLVQELMSMCIFPRIKLEGII
ncbi:MAG: hypothetical protein QXF77_10335, partial [Candidatus Jordarchaeales archaeon]